MTSGIDEPAPDGALVADVFDKDCPSRKTMEHIGGKWGLLAVAALRERPLRFNALCRRVSGVSEKMMSQTLQRLERDGMVHREVRQAIPPHVEYELTPLGRKVSGHLAALIGLLEDNFDAIKAAQAEYDERSGEGR
ncbi:winged helix-turn-helix transcriptional regulator [Salininema proteolyticum]|uniref:Winged helix-turn-helix transcriptional regulator n=1 Tax=Salininema proteolyticum TaxID=1607685 RepID=A0ABV8U4R4_9ACTN